MYYNFEIHHRRSIRIPDYDYSQPGYYFVTICTYNKECLFGRIVDGKMVLNEDGKIISKTWLWLSEQYTYIRLHEWIIMPNHLHGIIEYRDDCRGGSRTAPTVIKYKPLGRIIGAFKTVSTNRINTIQNTSDSRLWQRNYWEHVIRDENDLIRVRSYKINNPLKWSNDIYYI
jgi:REP element-mobilizing transposase RayT